jgi:hypothetical protein
MTRTVALALVCAWSSILFACGGGGSMAGGSGSEYCAYVVPPGVVPERKPPRSDRNMESDRAQINDVSVKAPVSARHRSAGAS